MATEQASPETPDKLPQGLSVLFAVALTAATVVAFIYIIHFAVILRQPLSPQTTDWGQFGDFIGGVLNPFIALTALVLLAAGVQIQNRTLHVTKKELTALQDAAAQDRFASQFSAFVTLLADLKGRDTCGDSLTEAANTISMWIREQTPAIDGDNERRIHEVLNQVSPALRPTMSLIRALIQLVNAQPLPPTERERYLDILRSFITPEDPTPEQIVSALAPAPVRIE